MLIRFAVCAYMAAARLVELAWSRRNIRDGSERFEGSWSRRTFPLMVALHTVVIGRTLIFGTRPRRLPLLLLLAVQPLRFCVLLTLGRRWNARGAVPREMSVATKGPYKYVRHPNYSVVIVELAALPLAFGLNRLAAYATVCNVLLLTLRIHDEEALLNALPGYQEHFATKRRFLPRVF